MVPAPSSQFSWDYWAASPSDDIELICLMPNYVYIPLKASWDSTLHEVKEELWERAGKYPLYGMLHESASYVFRFINSLADAEEVDDESKRIRDIKPVCGVLNIIKRSERPGEQFLNTQISHLIGKGLVEFDSLKNSEVHHFRTQMRYLAERCIKDRPDGRDKLARLKYECPPRVAHPKQRDEIVPKTLISHLNNYSFFLVTIVDVDCSFTTNVHVSMTPCQHIENILIKKARPLGIPSDASKYVLKVCGREEYLVDNYPLIQYLYIQEVLSRDGVPQVMIVNIENLPTSSGPESLYGTHKTRQTSESNTNTTLKKRLTESSWNVDKNYSCTVKRVSGLNVDPSRPGEVICQVGIFHGGKPICEVQKTLVVPVSTEGVAIWDQTLEFPIKVYNLPRMARLCFGIKKLGKDNKDNVNKLAWANTMVFDYKEELRRDGDTLFMWTHVADETQGDDILLHPLGTVVSNPNTDSCAALEVRFSYYDCRHPIVFPSKEEVRARGDEMQNGMQDVASEFKLMNIAARQDPTYEMHEQERKDVWAAREYFRRNDPDFLPKLLNCVEWCERDEAATVARMLVDWPRFTSVEYALELLDYAYADAAVRSFAVKCLEGMSDEDLLLYLLQLVQALKHESYLMCDLAEFLLKRAFNNMTIGHYLFWHLRSEMHGPVGPWVSVRFGLILEAYLRGSEEHITVLARQLSCVDKLKWVIECVKRHKDITKARAALESHLKEQHCLETLNNFVSPLNPAYICKEIIPDKCRVMDSKMRPLMLEFENSDPSGNEIRIIMKVGDDLRQDMFTLQMLRIMDQIWKNEGYDFKLNPYNCISIEYKVGMIEVVEDAQTVANIQKQKAKFNATSAMSKDNILQWLKEKNQSESAFNKAVDQFTMSCAGYCVATYVLGIADRHPDNIMIKESGHLFHIDFGHFLGHFKHKLGIRRERVPFVLTHNFIHVINKGQKGSGDLLDFKIFREHCEMAFRILRRHGHLILSLFSMMISTGLPELRSEKDLQHLRDTLVLYLPEDKAIKHFHSKFDEAVKNAWTTKYDWTIHNLSRNN